MPHNEFETPKEDNPCFPNIVGNTRRSHEAETHSGNELLIRFYDSLPMTPLRPFAGCVVLFKSYSFLQYSSWLPHSFIQRICLLHPDFYSILQACFASFFLRSLLTRLSLSRSAITYLPLQCAN